MAATYVVPNVPLIPQDQGMACWYASTQMLVSWRREMTQSSEMALPDPSEMPPAVALYKADNGLRFADMLAYSQMMGLDAVPPVCPSVGAIGDWLHTYGPIWVAGYKSLGSRRYGHVVVITGISSTKFRIHDPEPVNVGARLWKPHSWLSGVLEVATFRDVNVNFLCLPPR